MRRAAVSIPSNIAEGQGRYTRLDERRFLLNARGSLTELETQIIISAKLLFLGDEAASKLLKLASATARPLNGLIRRLTHGFDDDGTPVS